MSILDFIFPKYCINCKKIGSYICSDCFSTISFSSYEKCLVCNRPSIDGLTHALCKTRFSIDGSFTSISYKGIIKKLVYQFKYDPYLSDLKNLLVDLLYEGLIQKEEFVKANEDELYKQKLITFVPLHKTKLKSRGYNQSEILAKELAKKLNIRISSALQRIKPTRTQVGLKREDRIKNISGAFSILPNIVISQYPNIFLIDDVLTTGSTLLEAANVLKRNGAKRVWGIALARD